MRRLYSALIRLHPRYFREQFGPEMMAIFEQASGSQGRLIADALLRCSASGHAVPNPWQRLRREVLCS